MLKNTFCHVPGIGFATERRLWASGIHSWEELMAARSLPLGKKKADSCANAIKDSIECLERRDATYFCDLLPSNQLWRLFPDFRGAAAYVDIETTGLGYRDSITTIALYDGQSVCHYIRGDNLDDFGRDIRRYGLVVTYNGKCFDIPAIESEFGIHVDQAHIDLRYVLRSLGYRGGLKSCESQLGIDRKELSNLDGYFAVLLWREYKRNKNIKALETLLAYNVQDVLNLETLCFIAYNMKLDATPFHESHRLSAPPPAPNPFHADLRTINRLLDSTRWPPSRRRASL